jgi:hypothetical protein
MIHIGDGHKLPLDIATESIAIIARKGAGKTHTGKVIAEGLITSHVQTLVVDPLDVWWGLRSGADGNSPGLDTMFGFLTVAQEHADQAEEDAEPAPGGNES